MRYAAVFQKEANRKPRFLRTVQIGNLHFSFINKLSNVHLSLKTGFRIEIRCIIFPLTSFTCGEVKENIQCFHRPLCKFHFLLLYPLNINNVLYNHHHRYHYYSLLFHTFENSHQMSVSYL